MITFIHYHRIGLKLFDRHMQYYNKHYNITPLESLAYDKPLPPQPLFITFDDGWAETHNLYPTFKQYPHLVTIFLVVNYIDTDTDPRIKRRTPPKHILSSTQIKEMNDAVNFQSHGLTHTDLTKLSLEKVKHELITSKRRIEEITDSPVYAYAYPYNRTNKHISELLQICGYRLARMGERMLNHPDADRYTLKSIGITENDTIPKLRYRLLKARLKTFLRG